MKKTKEIVQDYIIPSLKNITDFDKNVLNDSFWNEFTALILLFETNSKPLYKLILSSELSAEIKEQIISKIPATFSNLVTELAEEHLKGNSSEAINILLNSKGKSFNEEVKFIKNLKNAFETIETNRIIKELPFMFEKLQKEISDEDN